MQLTRDEREEFDQAVIRNRLLLEKFIVNLLCVSDTLFGSPFYSTELQRVCATSILERITFFDAQQYTPQIELVRRVEDAASQLSTLLVVHGVSTVLEDVIREEVFELVWVLQYAFELFLGERLAALLAQLDYSLNVAEQLQSCGHLCRLEFRGREHPLRIRETFLKRPVNCCLRKPLSKEPGECSLVLLAQERARISGIRMLCDRRKQVGVEPLLPCEQRLVRLLLCCALLVAELLEVQIQLRS